MLQAGASLCMLLAAAVTLSIEPALASTATATFALATGAAAGAVTRMLLSSGLPTKVISPYSPKFSTVGLSSTCTKSVLPKYS